MKRSYPDHVQAAAEELGLPAPSGDLIANWADHPAMQQLDNLLGRQMAPGAPAGAVHAAGDRHLQDVLLLLLGGIGQAESSGAVSDFAQGIGLMIKGGLKVAGRQ